jgi:protein SCO1/2
VGRASLLVIASTLAVAVTGCGSTTDSATTAAAPSHARFAGAELERPTPAPPLALHDPVRGRTTLAQQRGRYVLVTFIYTHCPDVCPLIASNLNTALGMLGARREHVRVLAVSVDPRGDTAASVRAYRRSHGLRPEFRYLIGSRPELKRVWRAYHVLALARRPALVDHVAYTALVDRKGRQRVVYDSGVQARDVAHDVKILMRDDAR